MTDDQMKSINEQFQGINRQFEGIDRQFEGINRQFEGINRQFEGINRQFEGINRQFEGINQQFVGIDRRFEGIDRRFTGIEQQFADLKADAAVQRTTLERVDAEVHRQGIVRESESHDLKMAIETFQTAQKVTNAKIDQLREGIDDRLVPLELAVRSHTNTLADHERRLNRHDQQA